MPWFSCTVAHREVCAGLDALAPGRELLRGLRLPAARAQQLRVGQHRKTQGRVLEARRHRADRDRAAARLGQARQLPEDRGLHAALVEEALQHRRAALVGGEDHDAAVLLEIGGHVVAGGLGRARVARQLLGQDAGQGPRRDRRAAHGEGVGHVERVFREVPEQRLVRDAKALGAHGDHAALLELSHVLRKLLFVRARPLGAASGLVEEDDGLRRDIVEGAGLAVQKRQVAVEIGQRHGVFELFGVGAEIGRERRGELRSAALLIVVGEALDLLCQRRGPAGVEGAQGFDGGQDRALLEPLGAALALHIEEGHGVDVVAPELDAHRLAVGGGEEVEDAAAPRELARALDLGAAPVAAAQQRVLHVLGRDALPVRDREGGLQQGLRRQGALHQARDRGDGQRALPLRQTVERGEALLLALARGGLGGVEHIVAHAEDRDLPAGHGRKVAGEGLGGGVVGADREQRQAERAVQRRGEIGPVHRRQAGNERRKPSALPQRGEGGGFLVVQDLAEKKIHTGGPFFVILSGGEAGVEGSQASGFRTLEISRLADARSK